mmetsp:Transcript_17685/g.68636  ORF Transcript_17685/g.68636 Transcript_17685/m.68636 type:complete len:396 (-) Transcript_17685:358-1545(-)
MSRAGELAFRAAPVGDGEEEGEPLVLPRLGAGRAHCAEPALCMVAGGAAAGSGGRSLEGRCGGGARAGGCTRFSEERVAAVGWGLVGAGGRAATGGFVRPPISSASGGMSSMGSSEEVGITSTVIWRCGGGGTGLARTTPVVLALRGGGRVRGGGGFAASSLSSLSVGEARLSDWPRSGACRLPLPGWPLPWTNPRCGGVPRGAAPRGGAGLAAPRAPRAPRRLGGLARPRPGDALASTLSPGPPGVETGGRGLAGEADRCGAAWRLADEPERPGVTGTAPPSIESESRKTEDDLSEKGSVLLITFAMNPLFWRYCPRARESSGLESIRLEENQATASWPEKQFLYFLSLCFFVERGTPPLSFDIAWATISIVVSSESLSRISSSRDSWASSWKM